MNMVSLSTGGGSMETVLKWVVMTLLILFLVPTFFTLFVPQHETADPYEQQIAELEQAYYLSSGRVVTATTEVWGLTGIYTPYQSYSYGITEDGWIYGSRLGNYSPYQYSKEAGAVPNYLVKYDTSDGLYHYEETPINRIDIQKGDLYTEVSMDNKSISEIFFTPEGKTTTNEGYYYEYTGNRYAFQPLRPYTAQIGGIDTEVVPKSTSLSLIWYQYSTLSGIAGQLTISGNDSGLSYLNADDIVNKFNASSFSSTFDMTFNNIAMHLTIRLDPDRISTGMSPKDCFDNGYWSVIVSSDAVATSKLNDASYDFNPNNIFDTLIKLFTFRITEEYNIDGWMGTLASLMITMPLYACLLAIAVEYPTMLILVAILGVIQALTSVLSKWHF